MTTADYMNEEIKGLRQLFDTQKRDIAFLELKLIHMTEERDHFKDMCLRIFDEPKAISIPIEGTIGVRPQDL